MASGFRSLALLGLGIAAMGIHGSTQGVDIRDSLGASAGVPVAAAGTLKEGADRLAASSAAIFPVVSALTDRADVVTASVVTPPIGASSALVDRGDGISITATLTAITPKGFGSVAGLPLNLGSLGIAPIGASALLADGPDNARASAGNGVLLTSINSSSDYRITAAPDLVVGDRIEVQSAVGGPISDITINPDATFTMAPGSTVSSFAVRVWSIVDQDWGASATQFLDVFVASSLADRGDRMQATGGPTIGVTATLLDRQAVMVASAGLVIGLSSAMRDSQESLAAIVASVISAASAIVDQKDRSASEAMLALSITAAPMDLPDLISSLAAATYEAVIESALHEDNDSAAGDVAIPVSASGSVQDMAARIASEAALPAAISSAVFELDDGVVSVIAVARSADAALVEGSLELLANSAIAIAADFAGIDRGELLRFGASLVLSETAGGYVAELIIPARTFVLSLPARSFTLSPDTGKKS